MGRQYSSITCSFNDGKSDMADDTLKAVAENKIKELERKAEGLRGDLKDKQSFHASAWAEYGSELCAGGMIKDEREIVVGIVTVEDKINLLRRFIDGCLDISREEWLKKNSEEIAARIVALQGSKQLIEGELSEIAEVKNLLNLTF